jgi:formate/nitrite transporter FocA (FNT family)
MGNLAGALVSATFIAFSGAFLPDLHAAFAEIAKETIGPPLWTIFAKAVFAGWLIALMVWLLPLADQLGPLIIILLTWLVAAGHFQHIIAGSVDALYGALRGATTWGDFVHFLIPTFLGNVVGGVAFVAAITSAEIAAERSVKQRRHSTALPSR